MKSADYSIYESRQALSNDGANSFPQALENLDALILGAGAAGLLCARTATARGRRVALVDHGPAPGRKIAVSGGGKANFTNVHMDSIHFVGAQPDFCESALSLFEPSQIMDILAQHRLPWEEREHGQLFGLDTATRLVEALWRDSRKADQHCPLLLEHAVEDAAHTEHGFCVTLRHKGRVKKLTAPALVLALGGPAWPQAGASEKGAQLARRLGHRVLPFRPVLVPLRMADNWPLHGLSGISVKARLCVGDYQRLDDVLFTHTGISGPAALQISCRWQQGQPVDMDFLPQRRFDELLDAPECAKLTPRSLLTKYVPQRLADALLPEELARRKVAELSRAARNALRDAVHGHRAVPQSTEGLRRAEATAGGVDTTQIDPWSMESLLCKRLFVVGELLDVTGHLGGYNLHWAWASGYTAGLNI